MCVEHINANGLDNVGMYRLCGSASAVETLKKRFNHSSSPATVKFGDEGNDINNIGSLLKLYLRELPEPLIPFARYFDCIAAIQMDETTEMIEKLTKFKEIIHTLPTVNRATIIYLLNHLYRLAQRSTENKMTPRNLGTCFGPSLLASPPVTTSKKLRTGAVSIAVSPASASITALSETMQIGLQAKVVEFMIENWHELSIPPTQSELRALPSIRETLRKRSGSRLASASASPSPASPTTTTSSSSPSSSGFLSPVPAPASASASISAPSPEPVSASSLSISLSESLPETTFRDEEAAAAGKKGSLKNKHVLSLPGSASPSSPTQSSTPPISSPLSKEGNIDSISLHLFLKHDKDNSKVLEPHEFVNLCSELGLSNEKVKLIIQFYDQNYYFFLIILILFNIYQYYLLFSLFSLVC